MPGWKITQSKKQAAKKIRLALWILALVLGILVLAQVVKFTQTLLSPWNLSTPGRGVTWDGQFNINLVVRSTEISLVSFSPKNGKITVVNIPDQTYLPVSGGYGNWQLGSVYDLGGVEVLKETLSQFFGLPVDGYVEGDLMGDIGKLPSLKTDLTLLELLRLKLGLSGVRFDKIEKINLAEVLDKQTLADGTQVFVSDPVKLDAKLTGLVEPLITSEQQAIAIFNVTDHPGLAQKAARLVTNIGGEVIIVANGQDAFKTTTVVGKSSKTLERLKAIFESKYGNIDSVSNSSVSSRAQINLFLGEDYFEKQP